MSAAPPPYIWKRVNISWAVGFKGSRLACRLFRRLITAKLDPKAKATDNETQYMIPVIEMKAEVCLTWRHI